MHDENIYTLFMLDDLHFIREAYQRLLGRQADAEGERYYLGRIAAGHTREEIIAQLATSREATPGAARIPGVRQFIKQREYKRHWLWRHFKFLSGRVTYQQQTNASLWHINQTLQQLVRALSTPLQAVLVQTELCETSPVDSTDRPPDDVDQTTFPGNYRPSTTLIENISKIQTGNDPTAFFQQLQQALSDSQETRKLARHI